MTSAFGSYHPAVGFCYFAAVILLGLCFLNPFFLPVSLAGAALFSYQLRGRGARGPGLRLMLPLFLLMAVLNPVFVHQGRTLLFYLGGSPLTLEATEYGIAAGALLASVLLWFSCQSAVMTTDKFLFLFGRAAPSFALLLSMTLRLVPRLTRETGRIAQAQKALGLDASAGGPVARARHGLSLFSILTVWAMENSLETADSMRARGYGLPGRTAFSVYRFRRRDAVCLTVILAAAAVCLAGLFTGATAFRFYPTAQWDGAEPFTAVCAGAWTLLCLLPTAIEFWEGLKWRSSSSAA